MYVQKVSDDEFKQNDEFINGLTNYRLVMNKNVNLDQSEFIACVDYNDERTRVHFKYFPPGAVLLLKVALNESTYDQVKLVRKQLAELISCQIGTSFSTNSEIEKIVNELSDDELNILLYRCSPEESSEQINSDVYSLPAPTNSLIYAGLQGFINILEHECLQNNLGHPMFDNLRQGNWMLDFISSRLHKYAQMATSDGNSRRQALENLSNWLTRVFTSLGSLPRYLIPAYFESLITHLHTKTTERCFYLMSSTNR